MVPPRTLTAHGAPCNGAPGRFERPPAQGKGIRPRGAAALTQERAAPAADAIGGALGMGWRTARCSRPCAREGGLGARLMSRGLHLEVTAVPARAAGGERCKDKLPVAF